MVQDNTKCYVCGRDNAAGLQASFTHDPEHRSLHGIFMPRPEHEGWQGIVHGGIIAALMDEAMAKLASTLGVPAVTAEMTIKFRSPAVAGKDLHITARLTRDASRLIEAEAAVSQGETLIGEATGKLLKNKR